MTKLEKRLLIFVTVAVCILLAAAIAVSAFAVFNYINQQHAKGDHPPRDIFKECAYVAQAHINCCDDVPSSEMRSISGYDDVQDWYHNPIGYCFYFEPTGYVLITSYDYAVQKADPNSKSPFYSFDETTDYSQFVHVYSLSPTTAVLLESESDGVRKYRTFESGSCFLYSECDPDPVYAVYAKDGTSFGLFDRIYPGIRTSYPDDLEIFSEKIQPNDSFRDRMLKAANKQLEEYGCSEEDAAKLIAEFVKSVCNYTVIE